MDHSTMDHGGMDDGSEMARCTMNMLFTWDTTNLCVVFRWWHIRSTAGLLLSLLAVIALAAGYEGIRSLSRRFERWVAQRESDVPRRNQVAVSQRAHAIKALLYAFQNFYAFMLMLVFMTYNGWVMIAVAVGSFVGFLVFGADTSATKETACH